MNDPIRSIDTKLIHAGEPRIMGAVAMPIFQSATFDSAGQASYHDARYIRLNNTPNHLVLHEKLAALEGGEAAIVTASGMAAITTTLLTVLGTGDRLLAQCGVYGGTHGFLTQECAALGTGVDWIDATDRTSWERARTPRTRAIFVEAMTNPLLEVGDLEGVVAFAKAHGHVSIIDNTFATPVNFRPLEIGFDLVVHSCTKYMNGHDDIVAGAVVGSAQWVQRITHRLAPVRSARSRATSAGRTFPARNGTIGLAYSCQRIVRSRRGVAPETLRKAMATLNLNRASREMSTEVGFVLAIPLLEPEGIGQFTAPAP